MRKIVVLPRREWLGAAFSNRSMAAELPGSEFKTDGMAFIQQDYPVRVPVGRFSSTDVVSDPSGYSGSLGHSYVVTADFESEEAVDEFLENSPAEGVFSDPQISPFPTVSPTGAVGDDDDVRTALKLAALHGANGTGMGVKVVIVDTGIDGTQINVSGGFNPRPGVAPGTATPDHGTMVAFDALISAPNAIIFDYALLQSTGSGWVGFLSDAIRAFAEIMTDHLQLPGPMVAVNSWGMYDTGSDAPVGNAQNYSRNPNHPFNQIVSALIGSGVDVVFAAGNCGGTAPDVRCGAADIGPGNSVHGANSHPDAISVSAVTINDDHLAYSSEGPGGLTAQKPDISGFSHFNGSGVDPVDGGTSAACPTVAGVIAALRSTPNGRALAPATLKQHLLDNARSVHGQGWSPQYGWGIVDADATFNALP